MYFTLEDYRKIEDWLNKRGIKDTSFERTGHIEKEDYIPIVQDLKNKTVRALDLACFINLVAGSYINVSYVYGKYNISLEKAIDLVPEEGRKGGITVTFLNEKGKWEIYQFNSEDIQNWHNLSCWTSTYDDTEIIKKLEELDFIDKNAFYFPKVDIDGNMHLTVNQLTITDRTFKLDDNCHIYFVTK